MIFKSKLESRYSNDNIKNEKLVLSKGTIGFFEQGWELYPDSDTLPEVSI